MIYSKWVPARQGLPRIFLLGVLCLLPACQQEMASQPSGRPDEDSTFFPDGRIERPLPPHTVARGNLREDRHFFTGRRAPTVPEWNQATTVVGHAWESILATLSFVSVEPSDEVETFPFPITREILDQGRSRYMIYCVVCHDSLGTGRGKIVERGYTPPPSYHIERLRNVPVGHFFDVITRGYGSMPDYSQQIPPRDRWAIAAYIRALQWSQHFPVKDLPPDMRHEWEQKQQAIPAGRPSS